MGKITVRQAQDYLDALGYRLSNDGIPGPKTQAALGQFRRDHHLPDNLTEQELFLLLRQEAGKPEKKTQKPQGFWENIRYFSREEPGIACPCGRCGGFPVEPGEELMEAADGIREELGPMVPSSTVRCQAHNDELPGSVKNSRHILGKAMDFSCPKAAPARIAECLERKKNEGTIRYWYAMSGGWYHFDVE